MTLGHKIHIRTDNEQFFKSALRALRRDRNKLLEKIRRLPLELRFAGFRCVIDREECLDTLLDTLQRKLNDYNEGAV